MKRKGSRLALPKRVLPPPLECLSDDDDDFEACCPESGTRKIYKRKIVEVTTCAESNDSSKKCAHDHDCVRNGDNNDAECVTVGHEGGIQVIEASSSSKSGINDKQLSGIHANTEVFEVGKIVNLDNNIINKSDHFVCGRQKSPLEINKNVDDRLESDGIDSNAHKGVCGNKAADITKSVFDTNDLYTKKAVKDQLDVDKDNVINCIVCSQDISSLTEHERMSHVNSCLDVQQQAVKLKSESNSAESCPEPKQSLETVKLACEIKKNGVIRHYSPFGFNKSQKPSDRKENKALCRIKESESELQKLRFELGEIDSEIASAQFRKVQLNKIIKKLIKKQNTAQSKLSPQFALSLEECSVILERIFSNPHIMKSGDKHCEKQSLATPLWSLSHLLASFDGMVSGVKIDHETGIVAGIGSSENSFVDSYPMELNVLSPPANEKSPSLFSQFVSVIDDQTRNQSNSSLSYSPNLNSMIDDILARVQKLECMLLQSEIRNSSGQIKPCRDFCNYLRARKQGNERLSHSCDEYDEKSDDVYESPSRSDDQSAFLATDKFCSQEDSSVCESLHLDLNVLNTSSPNIVESSCDNDKKRDAVTGEKAQLDCSLAKSLDDSDTLGECIVHFIPSPAQSRANSELSMKQSSSPQSTVNDDFSDSTFDYGENVCEASSPETTQRDNGSTVITSAHQLSKDATDDCTKPDFGKYTSEQIRTACSEYGIKHSLPRVRVESMLGEIWDALHGVSSSNAQMKLSQVYDDTGKGCPYENEVVDGDGSDLHDDKNHFSRQQVLSFLRSHPLHYQRLLCFEPLDINEVHAEMKQSNLNISKAVLQTVLDEEGIFCAS